MFSNCTQVTIENALLYPDFTHTLINFRDIQKSGLHVCTNEDNEDEFFIIIKSSEYGHEVLERISSTPFRLYYTYIKLVPHIVCKVIFHNVDTFTTSHSRLGHPGIGMMKKIIENCTSHDLKYAKFLKSNDFVCISCVMGKLIL
jgi:hypothetical protein